MDGSEIVKHIPEIVSVAKIAAGSIPFTGIVKRMLGPAADEVAEMWRDKVKLYRYERQLKCVEKAETMAEKAGFTPQAVPPKILFPLLEGASFEDDEELHTMWAALLANAASLEHAEKVKPGFISILKQMASDEAIVLRWIYNRAPNNSLSAHVGSSELFTAYRDLGFDSDHLEACLNGLEASRLIQGFDKLTLDKRYSEIDQYGPVSYAMTARGRAFLEACHPPRPKS